MLAADNPRTAMAEERENAEDTGLDGTRLADKVRKTLGKVPFTDQALAAYYCAVDPRTPRHVKAVLVGALAYFVMPADMIPDFIAGLGYTDDAVVFWAVYNAITAHVRTEHVAKARRFFERETEEAHACTPS